MKILVTGAGGFIGGHLVADLLRQGHDVMAVDIKPLKEWFQTPYRQEGVFGIWDCTDLREHNSYCREVCDHLDEVDEIYNLAADMGGIGFIENNKAQCMVSVLINTNLLRAAVEHKVKRYFFSSSACAYNKGLQNNTLELPLKESDVYPANPEDGYGWEKLFSERMCRHFYEDYGLETRVARFHNCYGPHGAWRGGREKSPAAVCRKVIEAKHSGHHEIEIWGNGQQTRSFMYVDDCVAGIQKIMNSDVREPINLGSSELVSIDQLVSEAEIIGGVRLKRNYDLKAPRGVGGRNSDNTMIKEKLGWEPGITLAEGLRKTYTWIEGEYLKK